MNTRIRKLTKDLEDTKKLLRARDKQIEVQTEFLRTRQCSDHNGKWERGRCLQCEIETLRKLVVKGLDVVNDFMPNIKSCVLQDYGRMNTFTVDAEEVRRLVP